MFLHGLPFLNRHPDFAKLASKQLNETMGRTLRQIVETIQSKGIGDPPSDTALAKTVKAGRDSSSSATSAPEPAKKTIR